MKRLNIPLAPIDLLAIVGLLLLALGVGIRFGADLAVGLVGLLILIYAILASRSETTP